MDALATTRATPPTGRRVPGEDAPTRRAEVLALVGWTAVVGVAVAWGQASIVGKGLAVNAAPLAGRWAWQPRLALLVPLTLAALVVVVGPQVAARARWPVVLLATGAGAGTWALSLAASDGWDRVTAPLATRHEYEPFAAGIGGAGEFLGSFLEQLPDAPIHVQGHPPGAPLVPWALDAIGLSGAGWFAALVLAGWGVAAVCVLVAVRSVVGEATARRAAPALVLLPAALWAGTSADALFAGVVALGVTLAVVRDGRAALLGGAVLGLALMLTYGALALVALPVVVHLRSGRAIAAAQVVTGAAAVLVAVATLSGFSWLDGLDATRRAYEAGVAGDRPDAYFALAGNPGALAFAVGPAVAVGLVHAVGRWRDPASLLPLTGLALVALANASLLSKGEVERIWLMFLPWLAVAAPGHRRGWLAAQAALALVLQAWLRSKW